MAVSLSSLPLLSIHWPKSQIILHTRKNPSSLSFASSNLAAQFPTPNREIALNSAQIRRISAVSEDDLAPDFDNSQQITNGDSTGAIISALLFIAFVGLVILTLGVIYIAVTDFLQKREGEKIKKEEAAKRRKIGKKRARARAGPRGFGQKKTEDDFDDSDDVD